MARSKKIKVEGIEETTNQKLSMSGFGDLVEKITTTLGIEKCNECEERRKKFNKIFPFIKVSRDLTYDELNLMERINSSPIIKSEDVDAFFKMYNSVFSTKLKRCNCPQMIANMIGRINVLIN